VVRFRLFIVAKQAKTATVVISPGNDVNQTDCRIAFDVKLLKSCGNEPGMMGWPVCVVTGCSVNAR
jgi:hypothetical protein